MASKTSIRGKGRDLLTRAAVECFARDGRSAVTMREVVAASGVSVGTGYHHFPGGLPDLEAALYLETLAVYQGAYLAELRRHRRAESGVKGIVRFHLEWIASDVSRARYLVNFDAHLLAERHSVEMGRMNEHFMRTAAGWRQPFVEVGQIRRLPPMLYGAVLLGPAHSHASRVIDGPSVEDAPKSIRSAISILADVAWMSLRGKHS